MLCLVAATLCDPDPVCQVTLRSIVCECRTVGEMVGDGVVQFTRTTETRSSVVDTVRGMALMTAISEQLLDAQTGLFTAADSLAQMSFAEAVYTGYIEPRSAKVSTFKVCSKQQKSDELN